MNLNRLLNTNTGRFFISVLLGLGFATLFRTTCTGDKCITFNGPVISEIDEKVYKYEDKCYIYNTAAAKCDTLKRIVDTAEPSTEPKPFGLGV